MGATEKIAKWVVNTSYEDIPPDAIRVANESCFDLLGVILAGSAQPVGEIIQKYVVDQGAAGQATVFASGIESSIPNAALANGTMGHALDFDDFGGFGHPTVAIFPALLALGENSGASGGTCWKPTWWGARSAWPWPILPSTIKWTRGSTVPP